MGKSAKVRAATFKLNTADRLELKTRAVQAGKLEGRKVTMTEVLRRMIRGEPTSPSLGSAGIPDGFKKVTQEEIDLWIRAMLHAGGVEVVRMGGANGLLNVPGKYVLVIDAMHVALVSVAAGDGLPEIIPPEPKKRRSGHKLGKVASVQEVA